MIKEAFTNLYPEKEFKFIPKIRYSGRFGDFNASIKKYNEILEVNLSSKWKDIGDEIKIGLIQHLLMRLFKDKKETMYTELYSQFVKKLADYTPKTSVNPVLEESFRRVNEKYFNGSVEMPNLRFGTSSTTQLGSYNYNNDTVTISTIFNGYNELIDFIMYHELLHKKEKFSSKNGNMRFHTKRFRNLEKEFENQKEVEKKLTSFLKGKRKKKGFFSFFQ